MKKSLSVLLALCLAFCMYVPAFAGDAPAEDALVEEAVDYFISDSSSEVLYIRLGEKVSGVSESLTAEFLPDPYLPDELPPVIGGDDLSVVLPCEENGGRLELFLRAEVDGFDLHIAGLLDAQGNALECTVTQDRFAFHPLYFRVDTDEMANVFLHFYTGEQPILWQDDVTPMTEYCLVGETVHLPDGLSPALQNRTRLVCDGVELSENDDGTYAAVSGTGTVTYAVAERFSVTIRLCIQTPGERRIFAAREAAKRPLVTSYLWMMYATVLPVLYWNYAGLAVLPVTVLLGLVTLPLGYLVQVIGLRFAM